MTLEMPSSLKPQTLENKHFTLRSSKTWSKKMTKLLNVPGAAVKRYLQ
jgi:hypothetical protein